jgi:hypothetical protein
MINSRAYSKQKEKVEWLLKNQQLWEGYKYPDDKERMLIVVDKMIEEKMYSKKTYKLDILRSVERHIEIARSVRRFNK